MPPTPHPPRCYEGIIQRQCIKALWVQHGFIGFREARAVNRFGQFPRDVPGEAVAANRPLGPPARRHKGHATVVPSVAWDPGGHLRRGRDRPDILQPLSAMLPFCEATKREPEDPSCKLGL